MSSGNEYFPTLIFNAVRKYKVISIIGLSKNVSKTTTLNHIIKILKNEHTIGITSIGRDGEPYDAITELPKPKIFVEKDTIFATAEQSIKNRDIETELIKNTDFTTPLGNVKIYKAKNTGYVELAGPSINEQLKKLCSDMKEVGCDVIFIDGAFDRRSFATPLISDATILSTGASVSRNMERVVDLTSHLYNLFNIEIIKDERIRKLSEEIILKAQVGIINYDNSTNILEESTALGHAKVIFNRLSEDTKYLVIKGAITNSILEEYLINKKVNNLTIIATDSTKLFFDHNTFHRFKKKGGQLKILYPINLIAITVNHTSPLGYEFDNNQFMRLLQGRIPIPIFNLGPCDNL